MTFCFRSGSPEAEPEENILCKCFIRNVVPRELVWRQERKGNGKPKKGTSGYLPPPAEGGLILLGVQECELPLRIVLSWVVKQGLSCFLQSFRVAGE